MSRWLVVAVICAGAAAPVAAIAAAEEMTLIEVLEAASVSPRLARLAAELEAARADLLAASAYPYDPELELEAADRRGADRTTTDRGVSVSQRFELAGQRAARRAAAEADLDGARDSIAHARRVALLDAALSFARAVGDRERLAIERADAELASSFAEVVERRLDAGAATALDLALAQAGLARAERAVASAGGAYRAAQAGLAEVAGAVEAAWIEPAGDLPPLAPPPPLADVLEGALAERGDLRSARARVEAAGERLRLARSGRVPDLTVAARTGREEGDDLAGLSLRLPLPLFRRNRGPIARAGAELAAARAELAVHELAVRRQVGAAHARLTAALEARRQAERLGVTSLEEGLDLVERSFEAGRIGGAELLLYRRELVEGRRQAVAAEAEAWVAAIELAAAAGTPVAGMEWIEAEGRRP
jgi:cobalt-zinc-cadmium efflux system outer membrane protein